MYLIDIWTNSKSSVVDIFVIVSFKQHLTGDCFVSDEKLEGTGPGEHRSFLHSSSQWQRELLINNNNSNARLTSVSHRREDSDDIRSDTSSENTGDQDSDDTNNSGPGQIKLQTILYRQFSSVASRSTDIFHLTCFNHILM